MKRPRHYAAEIIAMPTAAERKAALEKVPELCRDITRTHVINHFALTRARRKQGKS
jgi:hypothetical protein